MPWDLSCLENGVGEIRTHEGLSPLAVFKTAAFNHSATTPDATILVLPPRLRQSGWNVAAKREDRLPGRLEGAYTPVSGAWASHAFSARAIA